MSRYLTPSKISVLALVCIYTESVVPTTSAIPILSFLISVLLPTSLGKGDAECVSEAEHGPITIDILQQATSSHASGIPGRTIWDLLLNRLWSIDSFDALHVYFENLPLLLQNSTDDPAHPNASDPVSNRILLSRASPLGVFVRKAQLEFSRLQFHDGVALWQNFVSYRLPTLQYWRKRNPSAYTRSLDINLKSIESSNSSSLAELIYGNPNVEEMRPEFKASADDVERLLEHQIHQMQGKSKSVE